MPLPEPDETRIEAFSFEDDIHEAEEQATGNMVSSKPPD
jgi:hypothetical protein